jgi:hypothetical protein
MKRLICAALAALCVTAAAAPVPYPYVYSSVDVISSVGGRSILVDVRLHNSGPLGASCKVKVDGQSKVTGVSASGDAEVTFTDIGRYKGVTVNCVVN